MVLIPTQGWLRILTAVQGCLNLGKKEKTRKGMFLLASCILCNGLFGISAPLTTLLLAAFVFNADTPRQSCQRAVGEPFQDFFFFWING